MTATVENTTTTRRKDCPAWCESAHGDDRPDQWTHFTVVDDVDLDDQTIAVDVVTRVTLGATHGFYRSGPSVHVTVYPSPDWDTHCRLGELDACQARGLARLLEATGAVDVAALLDKAADLIDGQVGG